MNNQSTLRYGGIAAIATALLYTVSIVLWIGAGESAAPPPDAAAAYAASSLVVLVTLYALFVIHRSESPVIALIAVLLLAVSSVASILMDPTNLEIPMVLILTVAYGIGTLMLGWLAYRSPRMSLGMAILLFLIGLLSLGMTPFMLMGSDTSSAWPTWWSAYCTSYGSCGWDGSSLVATPRLPSLPEHDENLLYMSSAWAAALPYVWRTTGPYLGRDGIV